MNLLRVFLRQTLGLVLALSVLGFAQDHEKEVQELMKKYPDFTTVFQIEAANRVQKPTGGQLCTMTVRTDERAYVVAQETYAAQALAFHSCTLLDAGVSHPGRVKSGNVELLYNAGKGKIKVAKYGITGTVQ